MRAPSRVIRGWGWSTLRSCGNLTVQVGFTANKAFHSLPALLHSKWEEAHGDVSEEWLLSPRHPYWQTGRATFFTAVRDGPVGRAALIIDSQHRERWAQGDAYIGFFECCNDADVAQALIRAVTSEARKFSTRRLLATASPSANYAVGVQVDGFDAAPVVMLSPGLPYYPGLFEKLGFHGVLDWRAVLMDRERALAGAELVSRRRCDQHDLTCRPPRPDELWDRRDKLRDVYNSSFSGSWGFTPMGAGEFDALIERLQRSVVQDLTLLAFIDERLVGFMLTVGSAISADGRSIPPHVLWLCVAAEYQRHGVGVALVDDFVQAFGASSFPSVEYHINEQDPFMAFVAQSLGTEVVKRYRLYALELERSEVSG
jgi:GNAT superfamily N-acetyltransferase